MKANLASIGWEASTGQSILSGDLWPYKWKQIKLISLLVYEFGHCTTCRTCISWRLVLYIKHCINYTVSQKKGDTILLSISSLIIDRFS